ncbi:MAG TPA: response regulator transcription factor [Anaerolineales bacterium]|nr:response regulator transcription factor [Anaerolineales bacterium]
MIRVLLNVPSPALRAGLRALLASDKTIRVVNDSLEEDDLQSEADVVITSASHASFSNSNIIESTSSAATLFLSDNQPNVRSLTRSLRVWGVLPTDASAEELTAAVHALAQGLIVGTSTLLFESESEPLSHGPLTDRESEVLGLLAKGLANKQIAVTLGISEHTVKFHVSSIYAKLNVTNRTEAVREGLRGGWIAL